MSRTTRLADDAIRTALTPPRSVQAPMGLEEAIWSSISTTPQRQPRVWRSASPQTRLVLQLMLVALLLVGLVIGALVVGSRPVSRPSVTTYHGGPERTGVMPGPAPAANPAIAWDEGARGGFGPWSPAVVDGAVYVGDEGGYVSALDESTGAKLWQVSVGAAINSAVAVADGRVLVGDDAGVLHVLHAATGAEEWSYRATAALHGSAAIVDGIAYLGSVDGGLYALDLVTRHLRWPRVQVPGPISRAIAVSSGVVYVGAGGATDADLGTLRAYDASDGSLLWSAELDPGNTSTPTVADGRVFIAGGLDAGTGNRRVFAIDAATGTAAWRNPFAAPGNQILLIGAVADNLVYLTGTDGFLYVLDASSGALAWKAAIQSSLTPNAAIVDTALYVTSDDRKLHAFDLETHAETWSVPVTGIPGAPTVIDGAIFVSTSSGRVVRIGNDE